MTHWREALDVERHRDYVSGKQDAGGRPIDRSKSDGWMYFVRACGFTFSFVNLDQLREAIQYFGVTVHPARRVPGVHLEHYWQHWFERLPPGLTGGSKRARVRRTLMAALDAFGRARVQANRRRKTRRVPSLADAVSAKRVAIAGILSPMVDSEAIARSLRELVERNGGAVHGVVLQRRGVSRATTAGGAAAARRAAPLSSSTFLGAGKAMELARLCRAQSIDVVVFLNALPRAQRERLASLLECEVVAVPQSARLPVRA